MLEKKRHADMEIFETSGKLTLPKINERECNLTQHDFSGLSIQQDEKPKVSLTIDGSSRRADD